MTTRLVIDTDIGTDVDDLWTLAMVPGLADIELAAVTVVYGDTDLRAKMASRVLGLMDVHVPVHRGCSQPLGGKPLVWAGHEGAGIADLHSAAYHELDAVDALVALAAAEPGTLEVLAIGPLTNICTAMRRDPAFAGNLRRLVVMGGEFQFGWPEHNLACDVVAAEAVFASGVPTLIVPLDQTLRVAVDEHDVDRIAAAHPLGAVMADEARRFWRWLSSLRDGLPNDRSWAHDPLTLLAITHPELFTFTPMTVTVEPDGKVRGVPNPTSATQVATDVDAEQALAVFMRALGC